MCDVMEEREFVSFPGDSHLPTERKRLYELIERTPWLDWLLLTKRPQNFRRFLPAAWLAKPRENVWLMTTVENAEYLWRVEELLNTPAMVRGLSMEPLLGPVDLRDINGKDSLCKWDRGCAMNHLDWVIAGGESGPGARPSHPDWFRSLRDQCQAAGVAFHFKQWGEWGLAAEHGFSDYQQRESHTFSIGDRLGVELIHIGKKDAGRLLDGRTWDELPKVGA
jgi:protein gp37